MQPFVDVPEGDVLLRRARVPGCLLETRADGLVGCDILVQGGAIAAVGPGLLGGAVEVDLGHGIVFPGFVDLHTHLDKAHILHRTRNPDGTLQGAMAAVKADREANWSAEDVATRIGFGLRCAYAHGTVAVRTHLDSLGPQAEITWPVFRQLRDEWAGRIALQAVALVPIFAHAGPDGERLADIVAESGGLLGGSGMGVESEAPGWVRRLFDLAVDRDLDLDLHVDETGDPAARLLPLVAAETIRRGWQGRVTCGHCCSLAVQDRSLARETIAVVADAGITVVSLPMVNLYLQGRGPGTPTWRGVTLLHELRAAGVRTVLASDNTRDPFFPFGDLDMVEVFRESVRIGHLDLPIDPWPGAVAAFPAETMGLSGGRVRVGAAADLVLFSGRDWSELLSRPQADRVVLRGGRAIDPTPPSYRDLV